MATDPDLDGPLLPAGGIPPAPEPDYRRVRERIRRRQRLFQAGLVAGVAAVPALLPLAERAATQGILLILQGALLGALVLWRRSVVGDAEAIACGVGTEVVRTVRQRRQRTWFIACVIAGCAAGLVLAWLASRS